MIYLPQLDPNLPDRFPDPCSALSDPNGLLAFGGDLSPPRLLEAYRLGIFPWFSVDEPILWWSPDPRCVFRTEALMMHRNLRRQLAGKHWRLTVDHAFEKVIRACAAPRSGDSNTWIMPSMIDGYSRLHRAGPRPQRGGVGRSATGRWHLWRRCRPAVLRRIDVQRRERRFEDCPDRARRPAAWHGFPVDRHSGQQLAHARSGQGALEVPRLDYLQDVELLTQLPGYVGSWADYTPRLLQLCLS